MKVALYVPPIPDENTTPQLGPLYLLGVLERAGFDGRLFDARIDRRAFLKLLAFEPDLVGVSAVTPGYLGGLRAASRLKQHRPEVPVVFGGPHPSSLPQEVASVPVVDYVLTGESEQTFLDLCLRLRDGDTSPSALREVKNLAFWDGDQVVVTEEAPFLSAQELEELPFPAFHRMDLDTYFAGTQAHGLYRHGKRVLPLMSARGCPHNCTFCCRVMGARVRTRSVESVMAEVRHLVEAFGVDEIYFEDDDFTMRRGRALELLERLAAFEPPIHIKFANGLRADGVDREILAAMKKARVHSLSFGIESGSPATLARMKKHLDLEQARENLLLAKSMGFLVGANCILGYPGDTMDDVRESLGFFEGLALDSMAIVNLVPFPGTEVRALCEREGYLTEEARQWDNYFFCLNNPIPLIETPWLSREALIRAVRRGYRRMYLRPRWLWRSMRHLSPGLLLQGAAILLGLRRRRPANGVEGLEDVELPAPRGGGK